MSLVILCYHNFTFVRKNLFLQFVNIGSAFRNIYECLNEILIKLASCQGLASYQYLTKDLHVWPDFHGNRSPLSDQNLKGMVIETKNH